MNADQHDAQTQYVEQIAAGVEAHLERERAANGDAAALALVYGSIAGAATFLAKTMGAAHAIETLDLYAQPLRDALAEYGGPGVSVRQ